MSPPERDNKPCLEVVQKLSWWSECLEKLRLASQAPNTALSPGAGILRRNNCKDFFSDLELSPVITAVARRINSPVRVCDAKHIAVLRICRKTASHVTGSRLTSDLAACLILPES